jgi:hypothetical protein
MASSSSSSSSSNELDRPDAGNRMMLVNTLLARITSATLKITPEEGLELASVFHEACCAADQMQLGAPRCLHAGESATTSFTQLLNSRKNAHGICAAALTLGQYCLSKSERSRRRYILALRARELIERMKSCSFCFQRFEFSLGFGKFGHG